MTCPNCKQNVAPAHRYCPWCGTKLRPLPAGERARLEADETREYLLNLGDPRLA